MRKANTMDSLVWCNENITFEIFFPKRITESNHEEKSDSQTERQSIEK